MPPVSPGCSRVYVRVCQRACVRVLVAVLLAYRTWSAYHHSHSVCSTRVLTLLLSRV